MPMSHTLTAKRLVTSSQIFEDAIITISDGTITSIESDPHRAAQPDHATLTATFFDVHTHGAANHDVMEATPEAFKTIGRFMATRGVGHYLPTTVTAPVETTLRSLEGIANAIEAAPQPNEAQPIGIHLEGPFISHAKRGVHPPADIKVPNIDLFDRFQQAARGYIRLITIAPETPGATDLIAHCSSTGVRVSLGHTNATLTEAQSGIRAGAASATHTFNAMRALDHREPGVLGEVLDSDSLFAELICDGVHVAPELVRLWLKAKGEHRAILVTDSMSATGMPDGMYMLGTFQVQVADGRAVAAEDLRNGKSTLAGSILTLDRALANLIHFTGARLETAVQLATRNPAVMLGIEDRIANLAPGQPANFNAFDAEGNLVGTLLNGKAI
jgi:N-acetylglucosamine-6-phosphate deacetylase